MGLMGSGSTFSKLMDIVMQDLNFVINYIDDIMCHSQSHDQQIEFLEKIFERLRRYNLKINPRKCEFGKERVDYLGFQIDSEGVRPGKAKIDTLQRFPTPNSPKKIRQFLGIANYFRTFIRGFTTLTNPLIKLTAISKDWKGGTLPPEAEKAFHTLKDRLSKRPCMAFPDFNKPFELYCDAATGDDENKGGLGAILVQRDKNDMPRAVSYLSRTLKPHEENMSAYLLEMKSAVWAIKSLHHYFKGRKFKIFSDNKPLVSNTNSNNKSITRLQQALMEYDGELIHMPGAINNIADALSRNASSTNDPKEPMEEVIANDELELVTAITGNEEDFMTQQMTDPFLIILRRLLNKEKIEAFNDINPRQWKTINNEMKSSYIDENKIIRKRTNNKNDPAFLPKLMIRDVMKAGHATIFAGHGGIQKTMERISKHYYWTNMNKHIREYVKSCETCQLAKSLPPKPAPLKSLPIPEGPNQRVHIDLMGPLKSSANYSYILIITDAFTKLARTAPLYNKKGKTVARALFDHWISIYACPKMWVSDQGKEFNNEVIKELNRIFEIYHARTTPYHPQTNSSAESYNRSIIKYMTTCLQNDKTLDWHDKLNAMTLAYNTSVHQTVKNTPFALTYTYDPGLPYFDLDKPRKYYNDKQKEGMKRIKEMFKQASEHFKRAIIGQEQYYNQKAKIRSFKIGDLVMVITNKLHPSMMNKNKKFVDKFEGPFRVVNKMSDLVYDIQNTKDNKIIRVHINRLKKFISSKIVDDGTYITKDKQNLTWGGKI